MPFYTRYLSPQDYGIVALFLMFGQVTSGIFSLGLQSAAYRYYFLYKNDINNYKTLSSSILFFNLLIFVPGGFLAYYFSDWIILILFEGKLNEKLILLSFISGCLEYFIGYFLLIMQAQLKAINYSFIIVSRSTLKLVIAVYFILFQSLTYMALINAIVISQLIILLIIIGLNIDLFRLKFSNHYLKKSLSFSFPMVFRLIISNIHKSFDKIMLTNFSGLSSVGYYAFSEKIVSPIKIMADAIGNSWTPFFMDKAHENNVESKKAIINRYYEIMFIIMFISYGIICFSEEIILLLTTEEFYPAMYIVPIYVFYHIIGIMGYLSIPSIQFSEKTKYILPASIIGVITNLGMNLILIPSYGAIGAVIALVLATLLSNITHLYFGFKLFPLPTSIIEIIWKLSIVIIFALPVYIIMGLQLNLFIKIFLKIIMLSLFLVVGIKLKYLSYDKVKKYSFMFFSKINIVFRN